MMFTAPIWLMGLLPWGGLTLWLLLGLRRRRPVPFLELWKTAESAPRPRRRPQTPPAALVCLILATLAAVLAAAGPRLGSIPISTQRLLVIVDRGITMSDPARYAQSMEALRQALNGRIDPTQVRYINIPTQAQGDWNAASLWPATAINTRQPLYTAIQPAMRGDQLVLVLSNQPINIDNPHLIQFAPTGTIDDVAIARIGAAPAPNGRLGGQVMLGISNHSARQTIDVEVHSAGQITIHTVSLPPTGQRHNGFIDLPNLGPTVQAILRIKDAIPLDDSAYLIRQGANVKLEPLFQLPSELQRMVDVYQHQQPASGHDQTVVIARGVGAIPEGMSGVVVPETSIAADGQIKWVDHPITAQVQWENWHWKLSDQSPPADWVPLVTIGGKPAVAIARHPARRAWVGCGSDEFSRSPQFVMFWTDVLDWLAQGQPQYTAQMVHRLDNGWKCISSTDADSMPGLKPGLWQSGDQKIALNADSFEFPAPVVTPDPTAQLAEVLHRHPLGRFDLAGPLILGALALLALAAILWRDIHTA